MNRSAAIPGLLDQRRQLVKSNCEKSGCHEQVVSSGGLDGNPGVYSTLPEGAVPMSPPCSSAKRTTGVITFSFHST